MKLSNRTLGITLLGGQILSTATIALVHGYLGMSVFTVPLVGLGCGLVGSFILLAAITGKEPSA